MASSITMSEYIQSLSLHGEEVSLETHVVEVREDRVLLQPQLAIGGQVLWSGEPVWTGEEDSLSLNVFTMDEHQYLTSIHPINLGEYYEHSN